MGLKIFSKCMTYSTAFLLTGCGILAGGYVNVPSTSEEKKSHFKPEEGLEFANAASDAVEHLRSEASGGRVLSAGGLIPLTAIIGYKTLQNQSSNAIAALIATGAAVFGTRDYVLAPRFERIYARAEKALNCAIGEYAVARTSTGIQDLPEKVKAMAAVRAFEGEIETIARDYPKETSNLRNDISYLKATIGATDHYLNGPMNAQSGLLYKAVLRIISQANQQIADDQPSLAEDKALFGGQFAQLRLPKLREQPSFDFKAASKEDGARTAEVVKARETAYGSVGDYVDAARDAPTHPPLAYAGNYDGCAYEQVAGIRPPLVRPLVLGANDSEQGSKKTISENSPVFIPVSGGVGSIIPTVLNPPPPPAEAPTADLVPYINGVAAVRVKVFKSTPPDTYEIIVTDQGGTLKQFSVTKPGGTK